MQVITIMKIFERKIQQKVFQLNVKETAPSGTCFACTIIINKVHIRFSCKYTYIITVTKYFPFLFHNFIQFNLFKT